MLSHSCAIMPRMQPLSDDGHAADDDLSQRDLVFAETQMVEDDGTLIATYAVHLGMATDAKWPGGMPVVVKGSPRRYAIEHCRTLRLSKPETFRQQGETLISDPDESVTRYETSSESARENDPVDLSRAVEIDDEMNRGSVAIGSRRRQTVTNTKTTSRSASKTTHTYGKNCWIWCAAEEPSNDEEWNSWWRSLGEGYDHVTTIASQRKFARMLASAVVGQFGPTGQGLTFTHPFTKHETKHPSIHVFHGLVAYVDDPHAYVSGATSDFERMLRAVFFKHTRYAYQREYRFVVWSNEEPEEPIMDLLVTPEILAAVRSTPVEDHTTAADPPSSPPIGHRPPIVPDHAVGEPTPVAEEAAAQQPGDTQAELEPRAHPAPQTVHVVLSHDDSMQSAVTTRFAAAMETFRRIALEEGNPAELSASAFHAEWIVMRLFLVFVDPVDSFDWSDGVLAITFKTPDGSNTTAQMSIGPLGTAQYKIATEHGYEHVTCNNGFLIADALIDDLHQLGLTTCAQAVEAGYVPPQPSIALRDTERVDERSTRTASIQRMTVRNGSEISEAEIDAANAEVEPRPDDARITKLVVDVGPGGTAKMHGVRQGLTGTYSQRVRQDHVTFRVETMNPNATVVIDPPDTAPHLDGHVVVVPDGEDTAITITATSADGTAQSEIKFVAQRSPEGEEDTA